MAKAGTVTYFNLDNAAGSPTNIGVYCDTVEVPFTTAQLDVSTFGTQAKSFVPGQTNGDTITLGGPYVSTIHTHFANALGTSNAGTSLTFLYGPGGSVSGEAKLTGECFIASYNPTSTVGGRVGFTASLQISGAVTISTF